MYKEMNISYDVFQWKERERDLYNMIHAEKKRKEEKNHKISTNEKFLKARWMIIIRQIVLLRCHARR